MPTRDWIHQFCKIVITLKISLKPLNPWRYVVDRVPLRHGHYGRACQGRWLMGSEGKAKLYLSTLSGFEGLRRWVVMTRVCFPHTSGLKLLRSHWQSVASSLFSKTITFIFMSAFNFKRSCFGFVLLFSGYWISITHFLWRGNFFIIFIERELCSVSSIWRSFYLVHNPCYRSKS